jgi:pantoate--beta-alanine ligase
MKIIKTIKQLRRELSALSAKGKKTIGFVPTMGYFHPGHVSLMKASVKDNDITVVSLFVNPAQFGPQEDLSTYPSNLKGDRAAAGAAGVDLLFIPSVREMYPSSSRTVVEVGGLGDILCGASRPGHFKGVATIVLKLLNIVGPDVMYLGQKDAQQVEVIKRMVTDLNIPVKIKVCPTWREKDGLAMSSRNSYLSPTERAEAPALYRALVEGCRMVNDGERNAIKIISKIKKLISDGTGASIIYVSCVGLDDFKITRRIKGDTLIALAARIGSTRLIDNIVVKVK